MIRLLTGSMAKPYQRTAARSFGRTVAGIVSMNDILLVAGTRKACA